MKSNSTIYENEWEENMLPTLERVISTFEKSAIGADYARLTLAVPTLVMYGSEELAAPTDDPPQWLGEYSDTRLLYLKGAGHFPWLDAAEQFFDARDTFFAGKWPEESVPIVGTLD